MKRGFSIVVGLLMLTAALAVPQSGALAESGINWQEYLTPQSLIDVGDYHTVAVRADGTVAATGQNDRGQCDVDGWTDVIAVSAGYQTTVGLKRDGTVLFAGNTDYGKGNVGEWKDIVAVSTFDKHTLGLKRDGTVLACGDNYFGECNVGEWTDIVAVSAGPHYTLGLRADGSVLAVGYEGEHKDLTKVADWQRIRAIATGNTYSIGLTEGGTALAAGTNYYGETSPVEGWGSLSAVANGGAYMLGLNRDGKVLMAGSDYFYGALFKTMGGWMDLIAIAANGDGGHTAGLKKDGTAYAAGKNNDYGQCDVTGWQGLQTVPQAPDFVDGPYAEVPDSREPSVIFSNFNGDLVQNMPAGVPVFTPQEDCVVQSISNYHWNDGKGSPPGQIGLVRTSDGEMIGVWDAAGVQGYLETPNAFWVVYPNAALEKGVEYAVFDSDHNTWSQNSGTAGLGMSEIVVIGVPAGETTVSNPGETTGTQERPVLEGTWTGTYQYTGAEGLEKANVSQEARDRFRGILGQDKYFRLSFGESSVSITAEDQDGNILEMYSLPAAVLIGGSFSVSMTVADGSVRLSGSVYKVDGQTVIRGEYLTAGPAPGGVEVTFITNYTVFKDK